jgi:hypothetical protein
MIGQVINVRAPYRPLHVQQASIGVSLVPGLHVSYVASVTSGSTLRGPLLGGERTSDSLRQLDYRYVSNIEEPGSVRMCRFCH